MIISFTVVVIFLIANNNKPEEPKVLLYEFSDYANFLEKDTDGESTIYYYKDNFVEEIIDTLPEGKKTKLLQSTHMNTGYDKQVILKVKRDKNHEIEKVSVVDSKNTIELLEDQYGSNIQMVEYDSWDEAQVAIQEIEDSQVKETPNDGPVFLKSVDGTKISAFFKTE